MLKIWHIEHLLIKSKLYVWLLNGVIWSSSSIKPYANVEIKTNDRVSADGKIDDDTLVWKKLKADKTTSVGCSVSLE